MNNHEMPVSGVPENQSEYLQGSSSFLFDINNPSKFSNDLEDRGYEVVDEFERDGERVVKVKINKGRHFFAFGFRQIDPHEKKWFHGGNDNVEMRENNPFIFDVDSSEFLNLREKVISKLSNEDNLQTVMTRLNEILQREVASSMGDEDTHSLSQIIKSKKAACASKSTLAGALLKSLFPNIRAEIVSGYKGRYEDRITIPYGHEWLRIANANECVLYDPMYNKEYLYKFNTMLDEENIFSQYTVSAWPFGGLSSQIGITGFGSGLTLATPYRGEGKELITDNANNVAFQLAGQMAGYVSCNGGVLTLVNGSIFNEVGKAGETRLLFPLIDIAKT